MTSSLPDMRRIYIACRISNFRREVTLEAGLRLLALPDGTNRLTLSSDGLSCIGHFQKRSLKNEILLSRRGAGLELFWGRVGGQRLHAENAARLVCVHRKRLQPCPGGTAPANHH